MALSAKSQGASETVKSILVIDDSMSSRLVLRNMLQQHRTETVMVESVDKAQDYLRQNTPDAIFLDRYMPGVNGLQALKIFKKNPQTAKIPVVMFTSLGPDDDPQALIAEGVLAVLPKPFTDHALTDILQKIQQFKDSGGRPPAPAVDDDKHLQKLIRQELGDAIREQITPLLDRRLSEQEQRLRGARSGEIAAELERQIQDAIGPALQQTSDYLAKDYTRRIQDLYQLQDKNLEERLSALERRFDERLEALKQEHAGSTIERAGGDDGSAYYMLDSIVEENVDNDAVWGEAQERIIAEGRRDVLGSESADGAKSVSGNDAAYEDGYEDGYDDDNYDDDYDGEPERAGPRRSRWLTLFVAVLALAAVAAALLFYFRSL